MIEIPIYAHFIFSFIATIGFSIFLNAPKDELIYCGLTGAIGWSVFNTSTGLIGSPTFSNFLASFSVAIIGELLARKLKKPAILFIIPGIIPLVPGLGMYNTMLHLVQGDYISAIATGTDTLLVSGSIALGILVTTSVTKTLISINRLNSKK